nr:uncharacterized protein LOC109191863 [Ipomoea trifida]
MEQFYEIVRILGQIRQHGMNMDDSIAIASIIDKLPPSWKKVHRALMQRKEELTTEQLGSHLYIEEGIRQKEKKNKGDAGCATVHTLKRTVTFGRLEKHKWKVNLLVILANLKTRGGLTLGQPDMSAKI